VHNVFHPSDSDKTYVLNMKHEIFIRLNMIIFVTVHAVSHPSDAGKIMTDTKHEIYSRLNMDNFVTVHAVSHPSDAGKNMTDMKQFRLILHTFQPLVKSNRLYFIYSL
jgi:hypothetical protein